MPDIKIVLGALFGDEGKGVTVQWLCRDAQIKGKSVAVVRYCGGPQAAHTIVHNGVEHICSSYGSGVLAGVPTYYVKGALFDPICAYNEWKVLSQKMDNVPQIGIEPYVQCITPYDVISNRNDETAMKDGTCGKGVWACRKRHLSTDYFLYTYSQFLRYKYKDKQFQSVADYYGMEREADLEELYTEACNTNFYRAYKNGKTMAAELKNYDVLVFEGTQGLLLDAKHGLFPNVTATEIAFTNMLACLEEKEIEGVPEVYLVARSYLTRHGNGYEPKHPLRWDLSGKHETNVYNEYQGSFKTGVFERRMIERAVDRHILDYVDKKMSYPFNLVVTHMDLVTENGYIDIDNGLNVETVEVKDRTGFDTAMGKLTESFGLNFKHVYYNDSPESNIKKWK